MPRLQGVDIPPDRPTVISLTYLYGVGPKTARELCHKAGVNPQARARELGEDEVARIAALLDKDYVVEGQLRRLNCHSAVIRQHEPSGIEPPFFVLLLGHVPLVKRQQHCSVSEYHGLVDVPAFFEMPIPAE